MKKYFLIVSIIFFFILLKINPDEKSFNFITELENKYEEKIFSALNSIYNDRKIEVKVIIIPINNNFDFNNRNSYLINTSIIVEGVWMMKYDDNKRPILEIDGSRSREYIPIYEDELKKIHDFTANLIQHDEKRGDSIIVKSIAFDRAIQFANEDRKWRRQKQTFYALFSGLIALIVIIISLIIYRIIFLFIKDIKKSNKFIPEKINIFDKTKDINDKWKNFVIAKVNNHVIRASVLQKDFHWHYHENSDESFYVIDGKLYIDFKTKTMEILPGEMITVPAKIRHRTRSNERTLLLCFEHGKNNVIGS